MLQCKKEEEKNQNIDFYKILIFFFFAPLFFIFIMLKCTLVRESECTGETNMFAFKWAIFIVL